MAFSDDEINEFKIEAGELLDQGERGLLALDNGSDFKSEYDAIFRAFHSIKGAAGMMEMTLVQSHMHELENLLVEQKQHAALSKSHVDYFLEGIDICRRLLEGRQVEPQKPFAQNAAVKAAPRAVATVAATAVKAKAQSKVMVIDDEHTLIDLLAEILSPRGFEVSRFSDPVEAVSKLDEIKPDVILTDIQMPIMSGLDVLKKVRETRPDLPVVFISGHADKNILLQAIESGVYAVLEKPFHMADVVEVCRNAIESHRLHHLLNSSINLLIYQFSDLDDFLVAQGKHDVRNIIDKEIKNLLDQRRRLRRVG